MSLLNKQLSVMFTSDVCCRAHSFWHRLRANIQIIAQNTASEQKRYYRFSKKKIIMGIFQLHACKS